MLPDYINKTEQNFPQLTKGLKKVAKYLLNDPIIFAIHPAKKIGTIIGVSETMVIRFCLAIGYDGFSMLQNEVRQHMLHFNQLAVSNDLNEIHDNPFAESIKDDINLLAKNAQQMESDRLISLVNIILNCERIVTAGSYQSFAFAHWLCYNLNYILGNTTIYRPETDPKLIEFLSEKSCVIAFSFYRYSIDTIQFTKHAKEKNITVIAFTDSLAAPIVEYADQIILVSTENSSIFRKGTVTVSIINSILYELVKQIGLVNNIPTTLNYFIE